MTFFIITSYLTSISSFAFGIFVYLKNKSKSVNRAFFLLAMAVGLWAVGIANEVGAPNSGIAFMWLRIFHVGVCFIPVSFFHFSMEVIDRKSKRLVLLGYVISAIFILLIPSKLFIIGVQKVIQFPFYLQPGPLYHIFMLYFVGYPALAEWWLLRASKSLKGNKSRQALYVFFAGLIGFLGGLTSYLPAYNIKIYPLMNGFVFLYVFILAVSVLKHRLMDIDVIVKRTLVFAGIVAASVLTVSTPIALIQMVVGGAVGVSPFFLMVGGIAVAVLIYRPLARKLEDFTDQYLFQKKVNYRALLKEATEYLSHLDSLKWQARRIVVFLIYKARIQNASLYAYHGGAPGSLLHQASRPRMKTDGHRTISFSHPLVQYFKAHRGPLSVSELEEERKSVNPLTLTLSREGRGDTANDLDSIIALLKEHRAEAAIPCFVSGVVEKTRRMKQTGLHLRGILFLGHQKSDEPYTEEDLDVFFTLGQESSIAFENARLYDEAIDRARELEEINRKLDQAQTEVMRALKRSDDEKKRAEAERERAFENQKRAEEAKEEERRAKEEALEAKKKTEELQTELLRRQRLLIVEQLVRGLAHEIFNAIQPMSSDVEFIGKILKATSDFLKGKANLFSSEEIKFLSTNFEDVTKACDTLDKGMQHIFDVIDTLNKMRKGDDKTIGPFDFATFWLEAHNIILMQTHGEILEEVPLGENIPSNLPKVLGNPVQLTQVFLNLYRNALYAMNGCPEKKLSLSALIEEDDPSYLTIKFSDTGTGIPPESLPKVFDFGFSTKGEKGQGIGLNMCKTIIERFGGTITCQSEVGKGTTFTIKLRLATMEDHAD